VITTEQGLTFARDGDSWRCTQHPELRMYDDGSFGVVGDPRRYSNARPALAALKGGSDTPATGRARRPRAKRAP
jgi:hypothetical protein